MLEERKNLIGGGSSPPVPLFKRWIKLVLVFLAIGACVPLAPYVERLPVVGSAIALLRQNGTNVGAWYYDDVEEYFEAEKYMLETLHRDHPKR